MTFRPYRDQAELEELRWHWGSAYEITRSSGCSGPCAVTTALP
jgi:hypothetical protein